MRARDDFTATVMVTLFRRGGGGVQDYVQRGYLGRFGIAVYQEALAVFGYVVGKLIGGGHCGAELGVEERRGIAGCEISLAAD